MKATVYLRYMTPCLWSSSWSTGISLPNASLQFHFFSPLTVLFLKRNYVMPLVLDCLCMCTLKWPPCIHYLHRISLIFLCLRCLFLFITLQAREKEVVCGRDIQMLSDSREWRHQIFNLLFHTRALRCVLLFLYYYIENIRLFCLQSSSNARRGGLWIRWGQKVSTKLKPVMPTANR